MNQIPVLILEPDQKIASRLEAALISVGQYQPQRVDSLRIACRELARRRFELAIIPIAEANRRAQGLRALQPNLPIFLTLSQVIDETQSVNISQFQGILSLYKLEEDLPAILARARWPINEKVDRSRGSWLEDDFFSKKGLGDLCRLIQLDGSIQQVILSKGEDFVACGWIEDEIRAREVVTRVNDTWDGGVHSSQMQFYRIGDDNNPMVLFTRMVRGYLLTLVARQDASLKVIRTQSDQLSAELNGIPYIEVALPQAQKIVTSPSAEPVDKHRITYALVIWPIEPLPKSIQEFVRKTVQQIASEANCDLKYVLAQADRLHVVAEYPADKPSGWFVKLLKNGVEREIQSQFGLTLKLWESGYFATETNQPLSEAELSLLKSSK